MKRYIKINNVGVCLTERANGYLNLYLKVPQEIKNKLLEYKGKKEEKIELVVLVGQNTQIVKSKVEVLGSIYEDLGYGFGIITTNIDTVEEILKIREIQYVELPKTLYTGYSESNKASCIQSVWELEDLTGKGVLVGFIDSGIDFTHPAFRDFNDNTRIEYIYDIGQEKIWNKQDINKALKEKDPFKLIPFFDEAGHGTHVAGIACAGGKINRRYYGVAYESSIAMVKMTTVGKLNYAQSTQLMRGVKFLIDKSKEIKMPLVINLSFSTNDGAHDGNSLLESYISTINALEKIGFACAAGNEGDKDHHASDKLQGVKNVEFNVAVDEKTLVMQIYKTSLENISIQIKNPQGKTTNIIKIDKTYNEGRVGKDTFYIIKNGPTPLNINQEIILSLASVNGFITGGQWTVSIISDNNSKDTFDIWMPISEGLNPLTKFLSPNPFNTLGIPATVENIISVGSYNFLTDNISPFSGRGKISCSNNKPDLSAPGEDIEAPVPGGGYDSFSGTSMASPQTAGAAALLMQWGLVLGNDLYMYGQRLKYFLLKGVEQKRTDVTYPNPLWGYGTLCLKNSIEIAQGENLRISNMQNYRKINNRIKNCGKVFTLENHKNYIVEYDGDLQKALVDKDYVCVIPLDQHKAVVSVEEGRLEELRKETKDIIYVEQSALYTLNSLSPLDTSNISKFHTNPYLNLTGRDVLVGIIDTGIDYLNNEFIYEDDTTKILRLWDQTSNQGTPPKICKNEKMELENDKNKEVEYELFGTEYTFEEINNAINAKILGNNPYDIVDSVDTNGHGTSMAGIAGAKGRGEVTGAAPDCEFAIVKMRQAKKSLLESEGIVESDVPIFDSVDLILAIKYIFQVSRKLKKPAVILIPMGSNKGAHDGSSIVERYIDEISKVRGIAVVTGTGSQGDSSTHTSGKFIKKDEIINVELKVDKNQRNLSFDVWCRKPDKVSLGLVSPSGEVIEKIPAKLMETEEVKFIFEGSRVLVKYFIPEEVTGDELIKVDIRDIREGIWQIRLYGDLIVDGNYDIWLPQRELIKEGTRFLNPDPLITVTIPSTSVRGIKCAAYDQDNNSILAYSGRGYSRYNRILPDVASGGVNVLTTAVGGGTTTITGSSASAAVLAGAVALLLQWGIVDGNDPTMYSTKIKTYLIRGARKRPGDIYPNPQWGYGILDLNGVFENIRGLFK